MHPKRRKKLIRISVSFIGLGIASSFVLLALRQNINLYYTPQEVTVAHMAVGKLFRLGGLVRSGSVREETAPDTLIQNGMQNVIHFVVTDGHTDIMVMYQGLLPSLFREGKGVIAEGYFNMAGVFVAQEILAKHDENYKPPKIRDADVS